MTIVLAVFLRICVCLCVYIVWFLFLYHYLLFITGCCLWHKFPLGENESFHLLLLLSSIEEVIQQHLWPNTWGTWALLRPTGMFEWQGDPTRMGWLAAASCYFTLCSAPRWGHNRKLCVCLVPVYGYAAMLGILSWRDKSLPAPSHSNFSWFSYHVERQPWHSARSLCVKCV